jgi:hypothetical protein
MAASATATGEEMRILRTAGLLRMVRTVEVLRMPESPFCTEIRFEPARGAVQTRLCRNPVVAWP